MAVKRASEIKTWRDTSVGTRAFLAHVILERAGERYIGNDPLNTASRARRVEIVLEEVASLLTSKDPEIVRGTRRALGLPSEDTPPDR